MSKIGKKAINIPDGVTVEITPDSVDVKGPNASLSVSILHGIKVENKEGELTFTPFNKTKQTRSNWGTMRSLVQNAIDGSKENFVKILAIEGVGYRATMDGNTLVLNLGYSHPIKFPVPDGLTILVEGNKITVSGADNIVVGEAAATIRKFRKPEPYKGKGIRYEGEVVRRKAGKKAAGAGAA